jgi:hypothetical protein
VERVDGKEKREGVRGEVYIFKLWSCSQQRSIVFK